MTKQFIAEGIIVYPPYYRLGHKVAVWMLLAAGSAKRWIFQRGRIHPLATFDTNIT